MPRRRAKGWRGAKGGEGRCEKSLAAYVGFLARLAATVAATATTATAAAAALIRVRRYEIIKLGLNSGEGDGMTRGSIYRQRRVRRRWYWERWMSETMGRCWMTRRRAAKG